jgi:Uma2 family endonuclease
MSAQPQAHLSPEEYLAIDRVAEFRNEYYDGAIYEKQGGSFRHALITSNLLVGLSTRLKHTAHDVLPSVLRLKAPSGRLFAYPDLTVVGRPARLLDSQSDTLLNPKVLIEVLSIESELRDRSYKFFQYRQIESLQAYLLVYQAEPHIEVWRRTSSNQWMLSDSIGADATCSLESIGCEISEIYDQVLFDPQP